MIDTGYFAKIKTYPATDILIVISRYYPRFAPPGMLFKPEFAPSAVLMSDWKAGLITWKEYEARYRAEMDDPVLQRRIMQYAERVNSSQVHRFLCHEKDGEPCHRVILKAIIEEASR